MTLSESLAKRFKNMFFFSIWFIPVLGLLCLAGAATAPFGEYMFWYVVGAVVSLPLFVTIDMIRR